MTLVGNIPEIPRCPASSIERHIGRGICAQNGKPERYGIVYPYMIRTSGTGVIVINRIC